MTCAGRGYVVHEGCDHLLFVGFLGVGKSTLARNLAAMVGRAYVDTDRLVELMLRKSVREVFEQDGEAAFRRGERRVLERLKRRKSLLVSCGGGTVEDEECRRLMGELGTVVYLDGSLDDSLRQIRNLKRRPDFSTPGEAAALYERRRPLYESVADVVIDIRGKSFDEVASEAGQLLWDRGLL